MGRACTIPGYALVLPIVGIIVAVSFFHYPNKQDIRATLHNTTEFSTEILTAPNYNLVLASMLSLASQTAQSASLRPVSSWIYEGSRAVLTGVRNNAARSTQNMHAESFPDSVVIDAMLNSSNTWDLWWQRILASSSFSQSAYNLMYLRPDGLCSGTISRHVAFRGNCSSCSLAMAVLDDAKRAQLAASRVNPNPHLSTVNTSGFLEWTTNFSAVVGTIGCVSVSGSVDCPTNKYFGVAPNSYTFAFSYWMSTTSALTSSSRDCFGLLRSEMTYPLSEFKMPSSVSNGSSTLDPANRVLVPAAPQLGIVKLGADVDEIVATVQTPVTAKSLPTVLAQVGNPVVLPIQNYPATLNNVTPSSPFSWCFDDQYDALCFNTVYTLDALWPEMKTAVDAGLALFDMNSGVTGSRRTTWVYAESSDNDMFVLAVQSDTTSTNVFIEFEYRHQMDAAVEERLKSLDEASYIALACLVVVIACALSMVVSAMHTGAKAFEATLTFALEDAFQERLRRDGSAAPSPSSLIELMPLMKGPAASQMQEKDLRVAAGGPLHAKTSLVQWAGGNSLSRVISGAGGSGLEQGSVIRGGNESMISSQLTEHRGEDGRKISFPSASAAGAPNNSRGRRRGRGYNANGSSAAPSAAPSQFSASTSQKVLIGAAPPTHGALLEITAKEPKSKANSQETDKEVSTAVSRIQNYRRSTLRHVVTWALTFKEPRMLLDASKLQLGIARDDIAFIPVSAVLALLEDERRRALMRAQREKESSCMYRLRSALCCVDARDGVGDRERLVASEDGLMLSRRTTVPTPSFRASTTNEDLTPFRIPNNVRGQPHTHGMGVPLFTARVDTHLPAHAMDSEALTDNSNELGLFSRARVVDVRGVLPQASHIATVGDNQHEPQHPTAAFVLFDIGFSIIDNAQTTKEYLKVMDMVLSHFGRFGGCVERAEASTVIASFGLHVPCENACDSAVQCAASLLKAMEEKLGIWQLDEESLSLQMFATDYVICVDFGEASRHNFAYHFPINPDVLSPGTSLADVGRPLSSSSSATTMSASRSLVSKPIRQVVVHAPAVERLRGLIPLLREQRSACTVTTSVFYAKQELSTPCVLVDMVVLPKPHIGNDAECTREWEVVGLLDIEANEYAERDKLDFESRVIEGSIQFMRLCQYDQAWAVLRHAEEILGDNSESVMRLLQTVEKQRSMPEELRQPYRSSLNWDRRWVLADRSDARVAPPAHEVCASIHVSSSQHVASTAPNTTSRRLDLDSREDEGDYGSDPVRAEQSPSILVVAFAS